MHPRVIRRLITSTVLALVTLVMLLGFSTNVTQAVCLKGQTCPPVPTTKPVDAVTFWNPGDGRIDSRPTDDHAFYCNTSTTGPLAQTFDVWKTDDRGVGQRQVIFTAAQLHQIGF